MGASTTVTPPPFLFFTSPLCLVPTPAPFPAAAISANLSWAPATATAVGLPTHTVTLHPLLLLHPLVPPHSTLACTQLTELLLSLAAFRPPSSTALHSAAAVALPLPSHPTLPSPHWYHLCVPSAQCPWTPSWTRHILTGSKLWTMDGNSHETHAGIPHGQPCLALSC